MPQRNMRAAGRNRKTNVRGAREFVLEFALAARGAGVSRNLFRKGAL